MGGDFGVGGVGEALGGGCGEALGGGSGEAAAGVERPGNRRRGEMAAAVERG